MADDSIPNVVPAQGKPKSRLLASQACDACRVRKVRCVTDPAVLFRDSGKEPPCRVDGPLPIGSNACRRCARMSLACTFLLPVKIRGPRKRTTLSTAELSDTEADDTGAISMENQSITDLSPDFTIMVANGQNMIIRRDGISPDITTDDISIPHSHPEQAAVLTGVLSSSHTQRSIASPMSTGGDPDAGSFNQDQYPTDGLCNRKLLKRITTDYLELLYPLIPVVHRPTFVKHLERNTDIHDKHFLSLLFALSAIVVAILPRKFQEYQVLPSSIQFLTRREMIDFCYSSTNNLRGTRYFDEINHTKWAVSYLFSLSYFQVGETNLARMIEVESMQFARLLELHRVSAYSGLNHIEQQLRKKAFWLMFYAYVHAQFQSLRKEKLTYIDCSMLHDLDLEQLLPHPYDDESITHHGYGDPVSNGTNITSGFVLHSKLFWAALVSTSPNDRKLKKGACSCVRSREPTVYLEHLQNRLQELKYMLDAAPWYYRQWLSHTNNSDLFASQGSAEPDLLRTQVNTMRANIHVTHLWLQSIIIDQIDLLSMARLPSINSPATSSPMSSIPNLRLNDPKADWHRREDLCRQLLHILFSIPEISLEANGLHLIYKVRDVAVSLLACPFEEGNTLHDDAVARRAKEYLKDFADRLSRLDKSEVVNSMNVQSWIDTDRVDLIHDW